MYEQHNPHLFRGPPPPPRHLGNNKQHQRQRQQSSSSSSERRVTSSHATLRLVGVCVCVFLALTTTPPRQACWCWFFPLLARPLAAAGHGDARWPSLRARPLAHSPHAPGQCWPRAPRFFPIALGSHLQV